MGVYAYLHRFQLEMMAEQASRTEKVKHVDHEKRVEDGCGEFYMTEMSGTRIITCVARFAPIKIQ